MWNLGSFFWKLFAFRCLNVFRGTRICFDVTLLKIKSNIAMLNSNMMSSISLVFYSQISIVFQNKFLKGLIKHCHTGHWYSTKWSKYFAQILRLHSFNGIFTYTIIQLSRLVVLNCFNELIEQNWNRTLYIILQSKCLDIWILNKKDSIDLMVQKTFCFSISQHSWMLVTCLYKDC